MWPCSCNYHASPILAAFAASLEYDSQQSLSRTLTTTFHSRNFPSFHLRDDSANNLPPELSCDLHHRTPTLPLFFRPPVSITRAITITLFYRISIGTAFHRRKVLFTMLLGYSTNDLEIKRYRRHDRRFTSGEIEGAINVIADIHSRARTISSKVRVSRFSPSRNQR